MISVLAAVVLGIGQGKAASAPRVHPSTILGNWKLTLEKVNESADGIGDFQPDDEETFTVFTFEIKNVASAVQSLVAPNLVLEPKVLGDGSADWIGFPIESKSPDRVDTPLEPGKSMTVREICRLRKPAALKSVLIYSGTKKVAATLVKTGKNKWVWQKPE